MSDRLTPQREAEIRERTPQRAADLTAWLNKFSPVDGQRAIENAETVLEEDVPALLAELAAVRAELENTNDHLNWLERNTLADLQRQVQSERDGKKRWRDRAEKAEAQVAELAENLRAVNAGWSVARTRIAELEKALEATGRSLSSFIFDSDDPGADALGAQWLYHQAMPHADDPFAQPRAFRSSVFSEAAKAVEEMDSHPSGEGIEHPQAYLDGYSDCLQDAAERLEKLADQAAEGSEVTS
ncbi:hypothetical protein ACF1AL_14605 [Streptomyces sp. NPDC014801]|uniref:hypothetical protein n=1 Tax=Streptomyces sp. NPDC014801 TaxID=3364916 RepID=UPI0036F9F61F